MNSNQPITIVIQKKSMLAALVLTFLFGPIGLLYASVRGAIVTFVLAMCKNWLEN